MYNLIGVVGKLNSGKGAIAEVLEEEYSFISFSLADPLKMVIRDLFDIDENVLWGPSENRTGEVRRMLQELGTDFARKHRPNVWAEKLRRRIVAARNDGHDYLQLYNRHDLAIAQGIVVPDVRFPNESDTIRELGGALIRVVRPGSGDHETAETNSHESENAANDIVVDHTILNDSTLEALYRNVRDFMDS
jgi:hypothetical protein